REARPKPNKAAARWVDPATGRRRSISEAAETREDAEARIELMRDMSRAGVDLSMAVKTLAEYGEAIMPWQCEGWRRKHSTHIWLAGISAWSPTSAILPSGWSPMAPSIVRYMAGSLTDA